MSVAQILKALFKRYRPGCPLSCYQSFSDLTLFRLGGATGFCFAVLKRFAVPQ